MELSRAVLTGICKHLVEVLPILLSCSEPLSNQPDTAELSSPLSNKLTTALKAYLALELAPDSCLHFSQKGLLWPCDAGEGSVFRFIPFTLGFLVYCQFSVQQATRALLTITNIRRVTEDVGKAATPYSCSSGASFPLHSSDSRTKFCQMFLSVNLKS